MAIFRHIAPLRGSLAAALCLLVLGTCRAFTQAPVRPVSPVVRIEVSEDRPLRVGVQNLPLVEPHLAIDRRDTLHRVVVATVIQQPDLSQRGCAAFASFDGGVSWREHVFQVADCGDSWVAIRSDGSVIFAMIGDSASQLIVFHSPDGGKSWTQQPVRLGGPADHGTLTVDTTDGQTAGRIYVTAERRIRDGAGRSRDAVLVAWSDDGGLTFSLPQYIVPSNLSLTALNPVVLSDGTLITSWGDFGRTTPEGEVALLQVGRSFVASSGDGGRSFTPPLYVGEACARSFPYVAVDGSRGLFRDRLYWVCNDSMYEHVYLFHSSDRGERWSAPVLVNRGSGAGAYGRTAVVAVNKDGVVGVSWYDGRGNSGAARGANRCQSLFFTASFDGGVSFAPGVMVSSARNCPNVPGNGDAAKRWPAGGDYHGLDTGADGRFHMVWADSREGRYRLRMASARVSRGASP